MHCPILPCLWLSPGCIFVLGCMEPVLNSYFASHSIPSCLINHTPRCTTQDQSVRPPIVASSTQTVSYLAILLHLHQFSIDETHLTIFFLVLDPSLGLFDSNLDLGVGRFAEFPGRARLASAAAWPPPAAAPSHLAGRRWRRQLRLNSAPHQVLSFHSHQKPSHKYCHGVGVSVG